MPPKLTPASPRRALVLAALAVFWSTLLLALGVPGAGPVLVAALGGGAMVVLRRALGGRVPEVPLPRVAVRPRVARAARQARSVRLPTVPPEVRARLGTGVASLRTHAAGASARARERTKAAVPATETRVAALRTRAAGASARARERRRPAARPAPAGDGRAAEARALCTQGAQLRQQGRLADAVESFDTAVWIYRDLDEPRGLALALNGLGLALVRQRKLDRAVASYREASALLEELGDEHAQGQVLANLGTALRTLGRSDEARASWEDALTHLEPGSAEYARIRELRAVS